MSLLPPTSSERPVRPIRNGNVVPPRPGLARPVVNEPASGGFDIWGPIQRRKYLIALFALLGAGLGYLHYIKAPKVYSARTNLMISTQAPPVIVDGDIRLDKVSIPKHASLIASELVLSTAVKDGYLDKLQAFDSTSNPVGALKGMIQVSSEADETLTISCVANNADDIAKILNQVVDSYRGIIVEDSQNVSQVAVELIEKLANKLTGEKSSKEEKRLQLWKDLGIQSVDQFGNVINPHNKRLYQLQDQLAAGKRKLWETRERARLLAESLVADQDTGIIPPVQIKVAALDAQKHLGLSRADYLEEEVRKSHTSVHNFQKEIQQRGVLESRAWSIQAKIRELQFDRSKLFEVFGTGHKNIATMDQQIAFYEEQKTEIDDQIAELDVVIAKGAEKMDQAASEDQAVRSNKEDLLEFRRQEDQEWITMYQIALQKEQDRLVADLNSILKEVNEVSQKAAAVSEGIAEVNLLKKQIDEKDREVNVILDQLSKMNILANNYTKTNVRMLDEPKQGKQVNPLLPKSMGLGTVLGLLVGLGLAILVDTSEMAFRNPHEIFERLNIAVVGRIPRINTKKLEPAVGHASLIAAHKPNATASEAFRDVRTGLFFRSNMDDIKTILFTSPSPGDGKSTTVGNLAISIAQAGKRVILVDADFRRPRVHQYFGEELKPGLLDVLSGDKSLRDVIQSSQLQENLFLLTTGGRPKNPGELVTSEAFRELIEALRGRFDYVLIDSPPVLPVADPATIASIVDGVYLVTRIRKGVKLTAQRAKDTLDRVGANWIGVLVNGIDENPHYSEYGYQYGSYGYYSGYGYGYGYGYGRGGTYAESPTPPPKRIPK